MVNDTMVVVGPSSAEDVPPSVLDRTEVDVPDGLSRPEAVAAAIENTIAKYEARGATIRQAVLPSLDRFQDPAEVDYVVDLSR